MGDASMKILVVADIHGNRKRTRKLFETYGLRKFDIVIVCGDITQFQGVDAAEEILSILSRLGKDAFFVPGNCDPPELIKYEELGGALNIHGRSQIMSGDIGDMEIIGVGGSTPTPFNTWIEFSEEDIAKMLKKPALNSILVAHTPPHDTALDKIWIGRHVGSKVIREYILAEKPVLGIHAHIHEARGIDKLGSTTIVNPGPLQSGYHAIIDIRRLTDIEIEMNRV